MNIQQPVAQRKETGYAPVNGLNMYYEISGAGEPVIYIPAAFAFAGITEFPELSKRWRVVQVDLQGHGRTADVDRPLRPQLMADDIAALMKHLRLDRADVMGYSLGGGVATFVAIRHPELVRKLVIVSANFKRSAIYPEMLAQQEQVRPEAAEFMKQTPMYQLYMSVAPRPEDFPRLLGKIG